MSLVPPRFRPYVAALLGLLVTGLGHLYLRRWRRALAWFAIAFVVSLVFVPESAAAAVLAGESVDLMTILPGLLVGLASAVDAFRVAKAEQPTADRHGVTPETLDQPAQSAPGPEADEEKVECPTCGKPVDPDLGFCHWCTTEFEIDDDRR